MDRERPFLEHLDELRRRLFTCLILAAVGMGVALLAFFPAKELVARQLREAYVAAGHPEDFSSALISLSPTDIPALIFKFSIAGGLFLVLPFILVQLWGFVSPALRARERQVGIWILTAGPCLFALGFVLSVLKLMPLTARCLLELSYYYGFVPHWTAESYFGFFLVLNLAMGACFELPLVMAVLSAFGLIHPRVYGRYRRHWIVASFVIGGVLPPPEVVSMFIQAGALIVLYEVGILFSWLLVAGKKAPEPQREGQ